MVNTTLKIFFCIFVILSCSLQGELKFLCIGDSITEGGKTHATYRFALHDLLKKKGVEFSYIGRRVSIYKSERLQHEGYSGKNIHFLLKKISNLPGKSSVDVALIHAGHNSFAKDKPVAKIVHSTKELILTLKKANPQIKIFLACVIESGKLPKYEYIPQLNKELKKIPLNDSQVFGVDMNEAFSWQKHATTDKVHPNKEGAQVMARKWFEAMIKSAVISK